MGTASRKNQERVNACFSTFKVYYNRICNFNVRDWFGATSMALRHRISGLIPYIFVAIGAIIGVFAISERTDSNIRNHLNEVVTELCIKNIPTIQKENKLRDEQIRVAKDSYQLNVQRGDKARAAISQDQIRALRNAKRHVPTVEECRRKLF